MSALPSGKAIGVLCGDGANPQQAIRRRQHPAASATMRAPAASNSASGMDAARPAPLWTRTACFFLSKRRIESGTRATLVSPLLFSLKTPNCISSFKIAANSMRLLNNINKSLQFQGHSRSPAPFPPVWDRIHYFWLD